MISLILIIQLIEANWFSQTVNDWIGISAIPVLLGVLGGGPSIGIITAVIWTISTGLINGAFYGEVITLLSFSRVSMVLTTWWIFHCLIKRWMNKQLVIACSIFCGLCAKTLYLFFYYFSTETISLISIPTQLLILLVQTFVYVFSVLAIMHQTLKYSKELQEV
ncbi:hypothetical protein I4L69_001637 [Enterococcus faecium]|nr:hypothetical protein [Enterococcus faecium]